MSALNASKMSLPVAPAGTPPPPPPPPPEPVDMSPVAPPVVNPAPGTTVQLASAAVLRGATIRSQDLRVERFIAGLLSVSHLDASRERARAFASSGIIAVFFPA
jgi:hypothetical protein